MSVIGPRGGGWRGRFKTAKEAERPRPAEYRRAQVERILAALSPQRSTEWRGWAALTIAAFQGAQERAGVHRPFRAVHGFRRGVAGDVARGSGDAWLGVQYIGDRDPDRIAEYVQEREDALDGAVAMLDRAWAVPTPEGEPENVTKRHPRRRAKTGRLKPIGALRVGKLPRQDSNLRPAG